MKRVIILYKHLKKRKDLIKFFKSFHINYKFEKFKRSEVI